MSDRNSDQELADEMLDLLVAFGQSLTVNDVRQAFLLGLKIGRADQALSRPTFDFGDLDS
jgi:hypothetical protein